MPKQGEHFTRARQELRVIRRMLGVVRDESCEQRIELRCVVFETRGACQEPARAITHVARNLLDRERFPTVRGERVIGRAGDVEARVDQGAVEIEDDAEAIHPPCRNAARPTKNGPIWLMYSEV